MNINHIETSSVRSITEHNNIVSFLKHAYPNGTGEQYSIYHKILRENKDGYLMKKYNEWKSQKHE